MPTAQPERIGHLVILAAQEGILQPGDGGIFELILQDLEPRVLCFTDSPDQRTDFIDVETPLSQIALDVDHCYAGLTVSTSDRNNVALALQLRAAAFDAAARTATVSVHLLNGFDPVAWQDGFHAPTLIIDDELPPRRASSPARMTWSPQTRWTGATVGNQADTTMYVVMVNHEEQYSIWPADRELPLGLNLEGFSGWKDDCLRHIKDVWTDMRPKSLRQ